MAFELITFDSLKKVLELEKSNINEYPPLVVLKASVEDAVEAFLGKKLESAERTETYYVRPRGSKMIPLDALPVTAVASVTTTDGYGNQETLTVQEDFRITNFGLRIFRTLKDVDVEVTYTGGYAEGNVPAPISRAALLQTVHEYKKSPNLGAMMVETEGGSMKYPELSWLKHVTELLVPYKHPLKLGA